MPTQQNTAFRATHQQTPQKAAFWPEGKLTDYSGVRFEEAQEVKPKDFGENCCSWTGEPLGKHFIIFQGKKYSPTGLAAMNKARAKSKAQAIRNTRV
eukprot:CAMPEP_0168519090 /NCGR_PEP_ID=MMETSP0405-20121227/7109_1 /TAXON_ID=498012 /ORGANISM="Trichosphaerium sp, Strain Am-I-7 wt" /LENGTH=96 /DNA_ID=CAMNT_0008539563 /DNA_START=55 /DNA_END=345 /DNA_ORIENTATION=-